MNTNEFTPECEHCIHQDEACQNVSRYKGVCDGFEVKDGMYLIKDRITYKINPRVAIPLAKKIDIKTGVVTYPTNADRIRNMSTKELAYFMSHLRTYEPACPEGVDLSNGCESEVTGEHCEECWLEWFTKELNV